MLESEVSYNILKQQLFELRFLQYITKDDEELNKINQQIKDIKRKIVKEMMKERMIDDDKYKRK